MALINKEKTHVSIELEESSFNNWVRGFNYETSCLHRIAAKVRIYDL